MATLHERIDELSYKLDQLHGEVQELFDEIDNEAMDSVIYLADVPTYLEMAMKAISNATDALDLAESNAKKGGM
jgi:predicted  nucleic acid-binding Zn-ribbon protein